MAVQPEQLAVVLVRRAALSAGQAAARAALIEARLPQAIEALRTEFKAESIWLVGSFSRGDAHAESDVDLVVRGVAAAEIDRAGARVEALLKCPVDLIQIENCVASMWRTVMTEGKLL